MHHLQTLTDSAEFDAPASEVWKLLMDWGAIVDWMPDGYIRELELEGRGEGAIRHLVTGGGVELSERLDRADEPSGILELSLVEPLPWGLLSYRARGKLDRIGPGQSHLSWQGTLVMSDNGPETEKVTNLLRKSYAKMFSGIRQAVKS